MSAAAQPRSRWLLGQCGRPVDCGASSEAHRYLTRQSRRHERRMPANRKLYVTNHRQTSETTDETTNEMTDEIARALDWTIRNTRDWRDKRVSRLLRRICQPSH